MKREEQMTFAASGFAGSARTTKRATFFASGKRDPEMHQTMKGVCQRQPTFTTAIFSRNWHR